MSKPTTILIALLGLITAVCCRVYNADNKKENRMIINHALTKKKNEFFRYFIKFIIIIEIIVFTSGYYTWIIVIVLKS